MPILRCLYKESNHIFTGKCKNTVITILYDDVDVKVKMKVEYNFGGVFYNFIN